MKVAVTGATGFIGARLVARLLADGDDVRALVPVGEDSVALVVGGATIERGDVRDPVAVRKLQEGCELVYHLAGLVPGRSRNPAEYEAVNVQGTANVMRAALDAGVRHAVHCSTVSVHGVPAITPANEDSPTSPSNVYGTTKVRGEHVVQRFVRDHGLSAVVVRPTAIYGPGDVRGVRLFRDVARRRLLMIGRGTPRCHLGHVADVVAGLRLAGAHRPAAGECFVVGGAEHPTVAELISLIADAAGVGVRALRLPAAPFLWASRLRRAYRNPATTIPGLIDRCDFFTAERTYSITRAQRVLGFEPRVTLRDGIAETVRWYRDHGLL